MTDALVTQQSLEQWAAPTPTAQATQVAAEMWGNVVSGQCLAVATLIAVEQWATAPSAVAGGAMQTAVTVTT